MGMSALFWLSSDNLFYSTVNSKIKIRIRQFEKPESNQSKVTKLYY